MDFSLNEEQRGWQLKAREFAREELRPASLARDQVEGGLGPWDWEIMRKGSRLGFRTLAVPEEWGGPGADFVTQGIVMAELASFSKDLARKPMMVVATKIDAAQDPGRVASLEALARQRGLPFFKISSVTGEGIPALKRAMADAVLAPVTETHK